MLEPERKPGKIQFQDAAAVLDQEIRQEFLGDFDFHPELVGVFQGHFKGVGDIEGGKIIDFIHFPDGAGIGQRDRQAKRNEEKQSLFHMRLN